jgi:2-polyprenyl-3-methyl-5-hydroxy-6-metoxy-1,4-benzoquinol methylase
VTQIESRTRRKLSARTEPFDSYWQAPEDVEKGYTAFTQYYRANFLRHLPQERSARILVISCGPGYFVKLLRDEGYSSVRGIDSDPEKIRFATQKQLDCETAEAFPFLEQSHDQWDLIVCEQELNHLTKDEMIEFLRLCRPRLAAGGQLIVYGLNGANPITGAEALSQNFDHFNTFTEYSLKQLLEYCGYTEIRILPLKLYVFYKNPLNYVGLAITAVLETTFRILFKLYGKNATIFTKKIAAVCTKSD